MKRVNVKKYNKFKFRKNRFNKVIKNIRKRLKLRNYKPFLKQEISIYKQKKFPSFLNIKVCRNNIFCTLRSFGFFYSTSTGKYGLIVSKKSIRFFIKSFFVKLFKYIKFNFKLKGLFISIIAPTRLKKQILKILFSFLFKNNHRKLIICVKNKKCFNGCRAKKKRRKKGKRIKTFK